MTSEEKEQKKEKKLRKYLSSKGLKYTEERKKLLEVLNGIKGHFDADSLIKKTEERKINLSRATIYRNLPIFIRCGILKKSVKKDGKTNYENAFNTSHHDHLLCIRCGKTIEFKNDMIENLQDRVCEEYGFKPLIHTLNIKGVCSQCQEKINK